MIEINDIQLKVYSIFILFSLPSPLGFEWNMVECEQLCIGGWQKNEEGAAKR